MPSAALAQLNSSLLPGQSMSAAQLAAASSLSGPTGQLPYLNGSLPPIQSNSMSTVNFLRPTRTAQVPGGPALPATTLPPSQFDMLQSNLEMQLPMPVTSLPNAYEGVPIFLVPNTAIGTSAISLASLKRAVESSNQTIYINDKIPKVDTSKHFHVFVGDLSGEVDNQILKEAFEIHGDVSEAKVIRDPITRKSKGYGFVSFPEKENAEKAISEMNGVQVGRRTIRTNWANRRSEDSREKLTFEQVYHSTKKDNTSVYVGNISPNASEDDLRNSFTKFGEILEVRMFRQHCYGFVRFEKKECATNAIMEMNNTDFCGRQIRCSWGRVQQNPVATVVPDLMPLLAQNLMATTPIDMVTTQMPYYTPIIYNMPMMAPHH